MAARWAGSVTRSLAASLVSFALLAQVLFALPLAARMMGEPPLCTVATDTGGHAPAPIAPHTHDICLVCHGAAVPLALVAVALLLPALSVQPWRATPARHRALQFGARLWRYRSRAPPALA
ncbi:MAG: hypothetical protein P4L71_04995 [Acetobacteraceae bacterium]|nr:hypothetical protein [Acetobacteraceae bacterium]